MFVTACEHSHDGDGWIGNPSGSGAIEVHLHGHHNILLHNDIEVGEIHS